jgi:2-keto-4-pentenoate hydratase/2-oxohepta-3-ene-1,7-dioic acid hydratase in catechol pathway
MKIAVADLPWPFLSETRVIAQNAAGNWHDFSTVLTEAGIAQNAPTGALPQVLSYLAAGGSSGRRKIERALDQRSNGTANPRFLKPIDPLAKIMLTEARVAFSKSNDQAAALKWVTGFSMFESATAHPGAAVKLPDASQRYDVEAVLVAVLGQPATRVNGSAAARSIVGFTLMAQVTNRDMYEREWKTSNNLFAKNGRELSPIGPAIWVAGINELEPTTEITLTVNGAVRQRFTVADFAHSIANATKAWSRCVLEPGDMVALGAAICKSQNGNEVDSPIEIKAGDKIEVACAPIGVLNATITA